MSNVDEDFEILNGGFAKHPQSPDSPSLLPVAAASEPASLDFLFLVISQAANFKHRFAIRTTWAKQLAKFNSKLMFFVGNPYFNMSTKKMRRDSAGNNYIYMSQSNRYVRVDFNGEDNVKLEAEIREKGDMVQIDMGDDDNLTSTKTLVSIRWALTYCTEAKNLFILSDSAVLNLKRFEAMFSNRENVSSSSIKSSLKDGVLRGLKNNSFIKS